MGMNTDAVQRLYVAYFSRPADPVSMSVYSLAPQSRSGSGRVTGAGRDIQSFY